MVLTLAAATVLGLTWAFGAGREPVPVPEVVPPSATPEEALGPRLGPDGLAALPLGEPVDAEVWSTVAENGCVQVLSGNTAELVTLRIGTGVRVEVDGDDVVAVTLVERSRSVEAPGTLPDVWLGPTLGDAMADALTLPGARTVVEDPLGADGPAVTSILVDTDDGQVVFADPPYDQASRSQGRISHISVRLDDEVRCRLFAAADQVQPGQPADPAAPIAVFDATGTAAVRLGDQVADAQASGALLPEPGPAPGFVPAGLNRCSAWATTDGTGTFALADAAGRVVALGSGGLGSAFRTSFGLAPGQPAQEVAELLGVEAPPANAGASSGPEGVPLEGQLAPGVRAVVVTYPAALAIETIDAVLAGPLLASSLTLYTSEQPPPSC